MTAAAAPQRHEIVSSDRESLIRVDRNDQPIGEISKGAAHDGDGVLHRAFSVFLFNDQGQLLLQQRAKTKRLWPSFWANSCCSHPRHSETVAEAVPRRLAQELGASAKVEFVYKFEYHARYLELGSEHELCWVYLGRLHGDFAPNAAEVAATRWATAAQVDEACARRDEALTPWLKLEWAALRGTYAKQLAPYLAGSL